MSTVSQSLVKLHDAEDVLNKLMLVQKGAMAGRKITPEKDLCRAFERFETILGENKQSIQDPAELKKAAALLKNVRDTYKLEEKDASTWQITRVVLGIWGFFTGMEYVYIKGGAIDSEKLKSITLPAKEVPKGASTPIDLKEAELIREKVEGKGPSLPQIVKETAPPEGPISYPKLESVSEKVDDRSSVHEKIEGVMTYPTEEEAKKYLLDMSMLLPENKAACAIVIVAGMPSKLLLKKKSGEITIYDKAQPICVDFLKELETKTEQWKKALKKELSVDEVLVTKKDYIELAASDLKDFFGFDPIKDSEGQVDVRIGMIGIQNASNPCTVVWNQDKTGGKIVQWTGKEPPKREISFDLSQAPGLLVIDGVTYENMQKVLDSKILGESFLTPKELREREEEYVAFVAKVKEQVQKQEEEKQSTVTFYWEKTKGALGFGEEVLKATVSGKENPIDFVYQKGTWKVHCADRFADSILGLEITN